MYPGFGLVYSVCATRASPLLFIAPAGACLLPGGMVSMPLPAP